MPILSDLATYISNEASIQVDDAVLLLTSDDGELPRMRMSKAGVNHHGLISTPAGMFICDLHAASDQGIFADLEEDTLEVGALVRVDTSEDLLIEGNWPSRKIQIGDTYYAVPRNFAQLLADMVAKAKSKDDKRKKRRR